MTPNNVPIPAVEPGAHSFAETCAAASPSGASAVVLREPGWGSGSGVGALREIGAPGEGECRAS